MTRRHTQALTLVGSNANNGLHAGPLFLPVNSAPSLSPVHVSAGISLQNKLLLVCAVAKLEAKTNNKTTLLTGSLPNMSNVR